MNPMTSMMGGSGTNLFDILVNIAFGFVAGLMLFLGFKEALGFGSKLAEDILSFTGMGQPMGSFGFITYAPYLVIAPIGGLVVKQLSAVRSLKSFGFFAAAVLVGLAIAFVSQGYFKTLIS